MSEGLSFPSASVALLDPYLPSALPEPRPFVTLTFATSLDSSLSLAPGVRTRLSGPESKAMTHFLRSRHSAILIGVSTMLADDPGLNCRITGLTSHPRPIIIDPHLRWTPSIEDKVLRLSKEGQGLAPYVITGVKDIPATSASILHEYGGKYIRVGSIAAPGENGRVRFDWHDVFGVLQSEGLSSVMVEGGGEIINSLLNPSYNSLVDSVIVTVAPVWLGKGGVVVSPERVEDTDGVPVPVARLSNVKWHPFGSDVVLCGNLSGAKHDA